MDDQQGVPQGPPPHAQLIQMGSGYWVSAVVSAAAKLGLADQLADGPKSAAELAGPARVHAPSLHRLMRTLASLGILTERDAQRFALTPLGEALKTGAPGSARGHLDRVRQSSFLAWFRGDPVFPGDREDRVRKGPWASRSSTTWPSIPKKRPTSARPWSASMAASLRRSPRRTTSPRSRPWWTSEARRATCWRRSSVRHAGPRGVLFDRPHVVRDAPALLQARGVAERVTIEAGDFFQTVPAGGDAYLFSHVIHDWNEDQCLTILSHCRKAIKPDGRLLIVEMVLPAGDTPHPGKVLDIVMLVIPGGQERTEAEYAGLLAKAGFRLTRVVPTASAVSVVEAVPV